MLSCSISLAQKKTNGKIYIEHPALEIVNQFNEAFVKGDSEKIKSLVTENFTWRNSTMRSKPGTLQQLIGRSNYLSKNIENFEIKHYGGSYPDVFEYKKDGVLDVMTYTWMTGYDKNTGVELNMPRHANFRMNSDGDKIDNTQWHNVVACGKNADLAGKYLSKGNQVCIEGKLNYRSYEDKNGDLKYISEIIVNDFLFLKNF